MKTVDDGNPLVLPPALLAEVEAVADQEHRSALDVLQDAVSEYVKAKRWQRTLAYGQTRAKALGLTEDDIPRLIAEARDEDRRGH